MYYNGLSDLDVINMVVENPDDTTLSKRILTDNQSLTEISSLLSSSKCIQSFLCGSKRCSKVNSSMDVRHVFVIKFSDSSTLNIGISSVQNLMMLNAIVYRRDKKAITSLYNYFNNK
jgi:hypothetical protein